MGSHALEIDPPPHFPTAARPRLGARLPWAGSGVALLRDPTGFMLSCHEALGSTFALDIFGYRLLCLFSPEGVRNLWALSESVASKGLADYALLRHKVPDSLFAGRRVRPHDLFARDDVAGYLENLDEAIEAQLDELGGKGGVELFALTRRLGHRVGLASWGGLTGHSKRHLDALCTILDRLDASESFVHPHRGLWSALTKKRAELRALAALDELFAGIVAERQQTPRHTPDLFDRICEAWQDVETPEREIGIGRDVVLVHMGSQSNLYAAVAWTLIHLVDRPALLAAVRAGDDELLECCAYETIRLRQRSIVLRRVVREVEIPDGKTTWRVAPGVFLATMMSVTNTRAAPGLGEFDPTNFANRRFVRGRELAARELVTTFGHGRHSCPAQGFSVATICRFVRAFVSRYDVEPLYRDPKPLKRQIGGIARADRACLVRYSPRAS